MSCKNCGRQNPSGSLYCQDCGHRLGDWVPPERPGKMPTPPTGIARQRDAAPATQVCPRCGTANAAHMRFCNNCGYQLGGMPAALPAASPATPGSASAAVMPASAPAAAPARVSPGTPPLCWRCRATGDLGAEFCKLCGARYAEDPMRALAGGLGSAGPLGYAPSLANGGGPAMLGAPSPAFAHAPAPIAPPAPLPPAPVMSPVPATAPALRPPNVGAAPGRDVSPTHLDPPRAPLEAAMPRALLVAILKDGSDGRTFAIHDEQTDIGRSEGHLVLADDPYLSPRHLRVLHRGGDQITLRDLDSLNGVYVRLREPIDLHDGDMLLLGQQVLRFEVLGESELPLGPATLRGVLVFGTPEVPRLARLVQYTTEGVGRDVHYLYRDETVIGREQGDIVCTDDPFMSRRHAAITLDRNAQRFILRDLGSSNGTAIRIRGERTIKPGDQFRIGRHLFRYDRPGGDPAGVGRNESA